MSDQHDKLLITRVARQDKGAMRELYEAYAPGLTRFVAIKLKNPADASDVVHEAMLAVWKTADRYSGAAKVKSWVYSIARNKAVDRNRKNIRLVQKDPDYDVSDDAPDPEAVTVAFQNAKQVRQCVEKLGEAHRSAIHFAFYEDLTYEEISKLENRPVGTIKTRIMHAKKLLMRCLTGKGF